MEIKGLAHIGIYVRDLDVSTRFYEQLLGLEKVWAMVHQGTPISFLRNGSCVLELIQTAKANVRDDGIVDHVALSVRDMDAAQRMLLEKGIAFETEEAVSCPACFENGARWLMFRGPDGERLEISETL